MQLKTKILVTNYFNFKEAELVPFDFKLSKEQELDMVRICNSKLVYQFLFKEKLKGKPYTIEDAKQFNEHAIKGWKDSTHFVYLLVEDGVICAEIDIRSNLKEISEIGYWADPEKEGYITNALSELITLARESNYLKLLAKVLIENDKSQRVLERLGFELTKETKEKNKTFLNYELTLSV